MVFTKSAGLHRVGHAATLMTRLRLPRGFNWWVAATVGSELGAGVLAFALTWVASGHGPNVAAAVLTLTVAPSVVLGLIGGAVADRFGPRRVMIVCVLALMALSGSLAVAVTLWATPPPLLMITAVLIGTVAAFHRPAAGVFPRLFVADSTLGAAMARVGMASQLARTIAPPLGGLLIGILALSGVALLDVLGCVAMLITLLMIRPPIGHVSAPEAVTLRGIVTGRSTARTTNGVPALLTCVAIVAGAVIPAVLLGIPLRRTRTRLERGGGRSDRSRLDRRRPAVRRVVRLAGHRITSLAPDDRRAAYRRRGARTARDLPDVAPRRSEHNPRRSRGRRLHRARLPDLCTPRSGIHYLQVSEPADTRATGTAAHHQPSYRAPRRRDRNNPDAGDVGRGSSAGVSHRHLRRFPSGIQISVRRSQLGLFGVSAVLDPEGCPRKADTAGYSDIPSILIRCEQRSGR